MHNTSIVLKTVTPLWTGDAWTECKEIKPQSFLGALRFWFEVYCYAVGIKVGDYKTEKINAKEIAEEVEGLVKRGIPVRQARRKALSRKISLPSQIFGCNGYKGLFNVKINSTDVSNPLKIPEVIYKKRSEKNEWQTCERSEFKSIRETEGNKIHSWFFGLPYFWGEACIEFTVEEEGILQKVLYPLLNFIQKYGLIGGKNNLGYGRVKFFGSDIDISKYNEFNFEDFGLQNIDIESAVKKCKTIEELFNCEKIGLYKENQNSEITDIREIIKTLIGLKSEKRVSFNNSSQKRHYVFGSIKRDKYEGIKGPNATKIVPWINEIDERYEYGFISLVFLKDKFKNNDGSVKNVL
ncbi:MAG: type III-B CRISPR module RAMP protein Cmr1 [Firmicutes bacterium]|nr:type III-B CRISPR module RAMP protein Cmr1 [Bacillota bacterium]